MKKKITAAALVLALLAITVIGGTMAYFTDTHDATNTFTTGKVDIELNEVFDADNAKLLPGKANAVQKEVSIELANGSEDAWVWYEYLIPTVLDSTDGSTGTNNIVHVNSFGRTWDKYRESNKYWQDGQTEALALDHTWDHTSDIVTGPQGFVGKETVGDIEYNKYVALYHGKLSADGQTETEKGMCQVWMDDKVDSDATGYSINGTHINYDFDKGVNIIVRAYAMQADGIADVYTAYKLYNGIE